MGEKVIALVLDGKVQRILRFDELTSSVLLSNPKIIDITNIQVTESWSFDDQRGFFVDIDGEELVVPYA
jgi:hypothetical protein